MNILVVPDAFKETLSAQQVCEIVEGVLSKKHAVMSISMADGGEGTLSVLHQVIEGKLITVDTKDPLGRSIKGKYLLKEGAAFIELAEASGLTLLKDEERNPADTSTYGTGLIIKDAIQKGATHVTIGLGGSATNDGGVGIVSALGVRFLDDEGVSFLPTGGSLNSVAKIDHTDFIGNSVDWRLLTDVTNPLLGMNGASFVFGTQKGASEEGIIELEKNMNHLVDQCGERMLANQEGTGAAGGAGYCLSTMAKVERVSGIQYVAEKLLVNEKLNDVDLIITGEGKFDDQSLNGKVVSHFLKMGIELSTPVGVICGQSDFDVANMGDVTIWSCDSITSASESIENPAKVLKHLVEQHVVPFIAQLERSKNKKT